VTKCQTPWHSLFICFIICFIICGSRIADRNRVTMSPQLSDRSARAPQLLHSGLYMAMELCRSLEGGPQAVRGDLLQKVVRTPCPCLLSDSKLRNSDTELCGCVGRHPLLVRRLRARHAPGGAAVGVIAPMPGKPRGGPFPSGSCKCAD
jgi:hypothetical protein